MAITYALNFQALESSIGMDTTIQTFLHLKKIKQRKVRHAFLCYIFIVYIYLRPQPCRRGVVSKNRGYFWVRPSVSVPALFLNRLVSEMLLNIWRHLVQKK